MNDDIVVGMVRSKILYETTMDQNVIKHTWNIIKAQNGNEKEINAM